MGCSFFKPDPEIQSILDELESKIQNFLDTFILEVNKLNREKEEKLEERHKKLQKHFEDFEKKKKEVESQSEAKVKEVVEKSNQELKANLKELNKEDYEVEQEFLINEVDKLHQFFELGLELSEKLKNVTLNKLEEKASNAPQITVSKIRAEIEEVKKLKTKEFLDSSFGKPLKTALVKKGMCDKYLNEFKELLYVEREDRRKSERKEFNIPESFYENEGIVDVDLYKFVEEEYKGAFKSYIKEQMIKGIKNL